MKNKTTTPAPTVTAPSIHVCVDLDRTRGWVDGVYSTIRRFLDTLTYRSGEEMIVRIHHTPSATVRRTVTEALGSQRGVARVFRESDSTLQVTLHRE